MASDVKKAEIISIYLYGSVVYGTATFGSDYDLIVIVDRKDDVTIEARTVALAKELILAKVKFDINIYTEAEFLEALKGMEISFLECVNEECRGFSNTLLYGKKYQAPKIELSTLRDSISKKASNSWVKAKKKLLPNEDYSPAIGKKSAWHSLRIIMFGIQLATKGKIENIGAANHLYRDIMLCDTWEEIDEKYRTLYNELSTEFRKVAPK